MTLYDFILQTFDETELLMLCDSDVDLKKAKADFGNFMPVREKVRRLISFCERHGFSKLLAYKVKQARSGPWETYQMGTDYETEHHQSGKDEHSASLDFFSNIASNRDEKKTERLSGAFLRVFISYASEDKEKAVKICEALKNDGFSPWLDIYELLPGQRWEDEISKAIENSDMILICLSRNAMTKEGYVQKEIKKALDKALEMPEGNIFLVPARFDDCKLPRSMRQYQRVDLFEKDGYRRLVKSFHLRVKQIKNR